MSEAYEIGGIFKVIHSSKSDADKNKKSTSNCNEENSTKDHLLDLFASPTEHDCINHQSSDNVKSKYVNENKEDSIIANKSVIKVKNEQISIETEKIKVNEKKKKKKQKDTPERLERTLFIGNISLSVTKKTLKKIFIKFGEIENIRFRSFTAADAKVPKKVALIKKTFHSECKSMNAYLVYKCKESVNKALVCNRMILEGLHLRVDKVTAEKTHDHKRSLFVGNLPFNIDEESVHEHFTKCGAVENVRLIRDQGTGMGKGFGYVSFKNQDGVMFGLKLNGSKLNGRSLRVNRCVNQQKIQSSNQIISKNQHFQGLKHTSKKNREKGKHPLIRKSRISNNAMRRIENKNKSHK